MKFDRCDAFSLGAFCCSLLASCMAVKPACLVIDAVHAACAVITIPDGKGGTEEVRVSRDELVGVMRRMKVEREMRSLGSP